MRKSEHEEIDDMLLFLNRCGSDYHKGRDFLMALSSSLRKNNLSFEAFVLASLENFVDELARDHG